MEILGKALKLQLKAGYKSSQETLTDELNVQKSQKKVYISSLEEIKITMKNAQQEIRELLPEVILQKVMSSRCLHDISYENIHDCVVLLFRTANRPSNC